MANEPGDPRLTPARADLAAQHLRDTVAAPRYASPRRMAVATPAAPLTATPDADAPLTTQLLLGEPVDVYDSADGWAWLQSAADGYVGYAPSACLERPGPVATHRVSALQAVVLGEADIKSRPIGAAPFGALVAATPQGAGFLALAQGGAVCAQHVTALATAADVRDWVALAEAFAGAPYLWGGRTVGGLDCSALIQLARNGAGLPCPRDSDMQAAQPGRDVAPGREKRGDLIFWRGHVGVMVSPTRLLHANAHHMLTVVEPLAEAQARIAATYGPVTARRRWPGPPRRA